MTGLSAIMLCALMLLIVSIWLWRVICTIWWRPLRLKRAMDEQGIKGPPYHAFGQKNTAQPAVVAFGKQASASQVSHYLLPRIFPHFVKWSEEYGSPFVYWQGGRAQVAIVDPAHCKEILSNKFGYYTKASVHHVLRDLLGNGLVVLEGEKWAQHRRIVSPAFFVEKLKAMAPTIVHLAAQMLDEWQLRFQHQNSNKEIDVMEEFKALTGDVIAHTAFGSSYLEGKQVFELQNQQQVLFLQKRERRLNLPIPGRSLLPTPTNRYRWKLKRQIKATLQHIIQKRLKNCFDDDDESPSEAAAQYMFGRDLLGLMMAAYRKELQGSQKNLELGMQEVIDECKTFFFTGHETTSTLLTWALMLLALHSEWQEKAREEVLTVCGKQQQHHHVDAEALNRLNIVGMVLHEALRLYPPAVALIRKASKDMKLGDALIIPRDTHLFIPILALHVDPLLWGHDAHEFNPHRFVDGITKACKHPSAYLPFGAGPRVCVGQNFAFMEAKIVLSMILQRFRFRLSPSYKHAPHVVVTLQPQFGMQIIFEEF